MIDGEDLTAWKISICLPLSAYWDYLQSTKPELRKQPELRVGSLWLIDLEGLRRVAMRSTEMIRCLLSQMPLRVTILPCKG